VGEDTILASWDIKNKKQILATKLDFYAN